jgi:cytoskeleton protein RodZ
METLNEGQPIASTAGALLKQARQQRGLHIAALAVMLKVPQAKLEAVEGDRWQDLPDASFARALATAMARALKMDAAKVLALMPSGERALHVSEGLNQPFRERSVSTDGVAVLARPVVWGPLLLLVAAAAVYWFPAGWLPQRGETVATPAPLPEASAPASFVPAPEASAPVDAPPLNTPAPLATASAPAVLASAPLQALPASAPVVLDVAAAPLRLKASAASWVEVVDGRGQVLLSRLLQAGEEQALDGPPPFKLRVGNARATQVQWRGAPVDLMAVAKGEVARLELN